MRRHPLVLPATVLVLAACAHSPQAAPPTTTPATPSAAQAPTPTAAPATAVDPVGVYDFTATHEGEEMTGTMTITGSAGGYGGTITSTGHADLPIRSVTVRDSTVTVTATSDEGEAVLEFTLSGQEISGRWTLGEQRGTLTGRKRGG
ncbi:MAG TPA: hypothetical protein VFS08_07655 [Gemmatimonadaceae bacterium]|nr:hypothetical protein [Gemmatimonadaceae bacterium]